MVVRKKTFRGSGSRSQVAAWGVRGVCETEAASVDNSFQQFFDLEGEEASY